MRGADGVFYHFTIYPLVLLMEVVYSLLHDLTRSYGVAIVLLAVVVRIALTPLEKAAAKVVRIEHDMQEVITPQLRALKARHQGKALHEATTRLYRRYGYHPLFSIRALFGLLVQVPFLVAVFYMLAGLAALKGVPFLGIRDLSRPDGMLGGYNLLPFVMLVVSSLAALTMPGMNRRNKVQSLTVSFLFFLLLYPSPSGLILYWTSSNVLTLVGNKVSLDLPRIFSRLFPFAGPVEQQSFPVPDSGGDRSVTGRVRSFLRYLGRESGTLSLLALFFAAMVLAGEITTYMALGLLFSGIGPGPVLLAVAFTGASAAVVRRQNPRCGTAALCLFLAVAGLGAYAAIFGGAPAGWAVLSAFLGSLGLVAAGLPARNAKLRHFALLSFAGLAAGAVFNWTNNMYLFTPRTSVQFFMLAAAYGAVVVAAAAVFLRSLPYGNVVNVAGAAFFLAFTLKPSIHFQLQGSVFLGFILAFAFFWGLLALFSQAKISRAYMLIALFFLSSLFIGGKNEKIMGDSGADVAGREQVIRDRLAALDLPPLAGSLPNIYFLAAESVPSLKALELMGVPDGELRDLLNRYGFKIYPDTISLGSYSLSSTSMLFNMADSFNNARLIVGGMSLANRWLQAVGYDTSIICHTYLTHEYDYYDRRMPRPEVDHFMLMIRFAQSIVSGKFKIKMEFEDCPDLERIKRDYIAEEKHAPFFLYFHGKYPDHSPMTGICRPDEVEQYAGRLQVALKYLAGDLQQIREKDPGAIVVISGDHGPYLTESCVGIPDLDRMNETVFRDRWGAILAIRWPDPERASKYDRGLRVRQNIFPTLFAYLYDSEVPLSLRVAGRVVSQGTTLWESGRYVGP